MEELKKVINYNTYRIDINEDINELNLTKKQKQRVEEIISDILFKFKKMSYKRIDYLVIGNNKKHIIVDISIFTRSKVISFAVEFKNTEENIKYTLISDVKTEFQENFEFREKNRIYKRFLHFNNMFVILLERNLFKENIIDEISYFILKELKNNLEIINLYSGEKIKIPNYLKDKLFKR